VFQVAHDADAGGTHLLGEVQLPPAFVVKHFGKHDGGDGLRSSGGWTFLGEAGQVFTLYEWRCTTLSNSRGSGSPTVREFWKLWEPVRLHIGGRTDTDWQGFRRWLRSEYRAYRTAAFDPTWRTAAVRDLAAGIYEGRTFECMPILADALEEAGCTNQEMLRHCRGPGPHARGCWALYLVLGKS
jgi:hypothetical protein